VFLSRYYNSTEVTSGGLPYGFRYYESGRYKGFPVYFDVNLNEARAKQWVTMLQDGFYIDDLTKSVSVSALCYNGHANTFALVETTFEFDDMGMLKVNNFLQTFKVSLYETNVDKLKLVLEVFFCVAVFYYVCGELRELLQEGPKRYFLSIWNYLDLGNLFLQVFMCVGHADYYINTASKFKPQGRYEVYADLKSNARFLQLNQGSPDGGLFDAIGMLNDAKAIAAWNSMFVSLSTVSLILMTLRMLKVLDFQPRMGLVTRTLGVAKVDLGHFALLFGIVFGGFSMIAFINFGPTVLGFSAVGKSFESLFMMMVGADLTAYFDMQKTPNAAAGGLFFYIYFMVTSLVLLNILLAILVDAYADVKDQLKDADTMPGEISKMISAMRKTAGGKTNSKIVASLEQALQLLKEEEQAKARQQTLELPDFTINRQAIDDVLTRLGDRVRTPEEQAATKQALLDVLERFGSGAPTTTSNQVLPVPVQKGGKAATF
jgi:hypothetical protein